jgi:hypothetical protein
MTRDEQWHAWRTYAAGALSLADKFPFSDADIDRVQKVADRMLAAEQQRFDAPDHIADVNKMVEPPAWVSAQFRPLDLSVTAPFVNTGQPPEPRPWVDLTEAEITQIVAAYYATYEDLVRLTQDRLREKNGGTR